MEKKHKVKNLIRPWDDWAKSWEHTTSPSRPTKAEIAVYKKACDKYLRGRKNTRVLIFGATPELRDLVSGYPGAQVTVADINMVMIKAMTLLTKKAKTDKEVWIKGDWIRLPLPEKHFDLILGDFTFENLPFRLHRKYFENVHRWLKDSGCYAGRFFVFREKYSPYSFDELALSARGKKLDSAFLNQFWTIGAFFLGRMKTKEIVVADFVRLLEKNRKNPVISKILKQGSYFFPPDKRWFIWLASELKAMIGDLFLAREAGYDRRINMPKQYRDLAPVWFLSKK